MALRGTPAFSDTSTYTGGLEFCPMTANSRPFFDRSFHIPDSRGQYPDVSGPSPYLVYARPDAIPEAYDIPIGLVNRVLYGLSAPTGE